MGDHPRYDFTELDFEQWTVLWQLEGNDYRPLPPDLRLSPDGLMGRIEAMREFHLTDSFYSNERRRAKTWLGSGRWALTDFDHKQLVARGWTEADLVRAHEELGCPYVLMSRGPNSWHGFVAFERGTTSYPEHWAMRQLLVDRLAHDPACRDQVDLYRKCEVPHRPGSGRIVASRPWGVPLKVPEVPQEPEPPVLSSSDYTITCNTDTSSLGQVVDFLKAAPPAVAGTGYRDKVRFRVMVRAGVMLQSLGRLDLLEGLVTEHYAGRCVPKFPERDVARAARTIEGWSTRGTLGRDQNPRPRPIIRLPVTPKHVSTDCQCGCGRAVEQVPGKGRRKRWASEACRQRAYRRSQAVRRGYGQEQETGRKPTEAAPVQVDGGGLRPETSSRRPRGGEVDDLALGAEEGLRGRDETGLAGGSDDRGPGRVPRADLERVCPGDLRPQGCGGPDPSLHLRTVPDTLLPGAPEAPASNRGPAIPAKSGTGFQRRAFPVIELTDDIRLILEELQRRMDRLRRPDA